MRASNSPAGRPGMERGAGSNTIGELVRQVAVGSYGVVRVAGPRWYDGLLARFGRGTSGVRVRTEPGLSIQLFLRLAPGVPVNEVVSNVEKAVRYVVQRDVGRPVDELAIFARGSAVSGGGGAQGSSAA